MQRTISTFIRIVMLAVISTATAASWAQSQPRVVEIIELRDENGDGLQASPQALNEAGDVVGVGGVDAFLWSEATQSGVLLPKPGTGHALAAGINNVGHVVGYFHPIVNGRTQAIRALVWSNGSVIDLGGGYLLDINDSQQAVGMLGSRRDGIHDLSNDSFTPAPDQRMVPGSINNDGVTAGEFNQHAFRWAPPASIEILADLNPSAPLTFAGDISENGYVCGVSNAPDGKHHPVRWDPDGTLHDLGIIRPEDFPLSLAGGVNDFGQTVGVIHLLFASIEVVFYHDGTTMYDLNELLPPGTGWTLLHASDINNAGEVCGNGYLNGQLRGFRLTLDDSNQEPPSCDVSSAQVAVKAGTTLVLGIDADDPDGDALTLSASGLPGSAPTITPDFGASPLSAVLEWTPGNGDVGEHTLTVTVEDEAGETAECDVQVVVFTPPQCHEVHEEIVAAISDPVSIEFHADDIDQDDLTVTYGPLPAGAVASPADGTVISYPYPEVTIDWTPAAGQGGPHNITVAFTDQYGEEATCGTTVCVFNNPPQFDSTFVPGNHILTIGDAFVLDFEGLDADPGDAIRVSHTALPGGSTLMPLATDGHLAAPVLVSFAWTPTIDDVGAYSFDVTLTDLSGAQTTETLYVSVINRLPQCERIVDEETFLPDFIFDEGFGREIAQYTVMEGQTFQVLFSATDGDPGDALTLTATELPEGASLTPGDGAVDTNPSEDSPFETVFEWTPIGADADLNPHVVEITFTDVHGAQATCILQIEVNRNPICDIAGAASGISEPCENASGALVTLDGSASSDPDDDVLAYIWSNVPSPTTALDEPTVTGLFPMGVTLTTLTVEDGRGGVALCDVEVTVFDNVPPEVRVTTDIAAMWPPNHDMFPVQIRIEGTDACAAPHEISPTLFLVASDEPDNGLGDGDIGGDVDGSDGYDPIGDFSGAADLGANQFSWDADAGAHVMTIWLRRERSGNGDGRTYTILVQAQDPSGNVGEASCAVVVPHNRRGGG